MADFQCLKLLAVVIESPQFRSNWRLPDVTVPPDQNEMKLLEFDGDGILFQCIYTIIWRRYQQDISVRDRCVSRSKTNVMEE
jgi:hypothetical protein